MFVEGQLTYVLDTHLQVYGQLFPHFTALKGKPKSPKPKPQMGFMIRGHLEPLSGAAQTKVYMETLGSLMRPEKPLHRSLPSPLPPSPPVHGHVIPLGISEELVSPCERKPHAGQTGASSGSLGQRTHLVSRYFSSAMHAWPRGRAPSRGNMSTLHAHA